MVQLAVRIDTDRCEGHGVCEGLAPDVFVVGDDETAAVVATDLEAHRTEILAAAAECPRQAIVVET